MNKGEIPHMEPRRKERIMQTRAEMEALLTRMAVGRVCVVTPDGPYAVPVNYLYAENCIFFHSGLAGRKMDAIRADGRVCFLVDDPGPQIVWDRGCGTSQIYESVMCFGKAQLVEGLEEKRRLLDMLVRRYVPGGLAKPFADKAVERTAVVRIPIDVMTGKANRRSAEHNVIANAFAPPT